MLGYVHIAARAHLMTDPTSLFLRVIAALCSLLSLWSCASTPELDFLLAESPRGTVYLERIPDRSLQAAHPIKIDQETLALVLRGISIKDNQGLLQDLLAGQSPAVAAFTEDDVRYLAPLLAEALTRAAADQQVGFRLIQSGLPGGDPTGGAGMGAPDASRRLALMETTQGTLYAYGRSLYVTLSEFKTRSERPGTLNKTTRRQPDYSGLLNRTVLFTPESARRPDSYRGKNTTSATLIIDYQGLAALSTHTPFPPLSQTPPQGRTQTSPPPSELDAGTDTQLQRLQDQMNQKNRELEDLRKELQDIRRQMREPTTAAPPSPR